MNVRSPFYPFDPAWLMGTVIEVGPDFARINLPLAARDEPQLRDGERVGAGEVGEFVIIECGDVGLFSRLTAVKLPERDRLAVEPSMGGTANPHPIGTAQLLCTVPLTGEGPVRGIARHPRVGARVYALPAMVVAWIAEHAGGEESESSLRLSLAQLPGAASASVRVTPERLFGRHCAVLGATGGGKSWTLARIVESCATYDAKVLLIDATGEYHRLHPGVQHVSLGSEVDRPDRCRNVSLPYRELDEEDLFALFRPAGQVQAPKLRAAMRSLKLAALLGQHPVVSNGCIPKFGRVKAPFFAAYTEHASLVEGPGAQFDLARLPKQIAHECVYPSAYGAVRGERDHSRWGAGDDQAYNQCTPLIARVESYLATPEFAPLLRPGLTESVIAVISDWLSDPEFPVLRISLRHLAFTGDLREIVVNGLGRSLLAMARQGRFDEQPLVICLDEAHQFLNKSLGDDYSRYPLDAFDLVAKEGRKYSLSICLATQRPRDIPEAVLGQMGTLLVHRLTNDADRYVVERAAGDIDKSAAAFIPALAPGQALLLGVEYPIPLVIRITPPSAKPDSKGPNYQKHWTKRTGGLAKLDEAPMAATADGAVRETPTN